jgi:nucleoside-diphosphate-sugar epimerase
MRVYVSGATGVIGSRLVEKLAGDGVTVHALYRSESKSGLIKKPGVVLFKGDILDKQSVLAAMKGCDQAYHVAAFAGVWARDPSLIYRLNVEGSMNVVSAAEEHGVGRIVITSTAGVLGPAVEGAVHESSPAPSSFFTAYEESKFMLEQALAQRSEKSPEVVIVNPTRVYGPGLLSESNGVTRMIGRYVAGNWRLIPGNGNSSGNYVFVEDVVEGHLLAMSKGATGERYVLGGENITYNQLFSLVRQISGKKFRLVHIPLWLMLTVAGLMKLITRITGIPPMILPGLVKKFNHNWIVSSDKAIRELQYHPLDARAGIEKTLDWLTQTDEV